MTGVTVTGTSEQEPSAPAVLHVLTRVDESQGGSAAAAISIAATTAAAGSPVTLLTTRDPGDSPRASPLTDVELVEVRRHWLRHIGFSVPIVRWLWRNLRHFDLVEVHEVWAFPTLATWALSRARGVPLVIHPHGSLDPYDLRKHTRAKLLLRPGLRRILDSIAAVWLTDQREEEALGYFMRGGRGPRTVVSPLPVAAFSGRGDAQRFRAEHGLADDDRVALFLGRLDPKKGLVRLLNAFETVRRGDPRARLVIAGSGDPHFVAAITEQIARSDAADSIRCIGFVSGQAKLDALSGADLFVLHSDNENFGIAVAEALHCGTPVLLSDQVYISGHLAEHGAAAVVPVTDEAGLATELGALLADPAARARLADRAQAALADYHPDTVAQRDAAIRAQLVARQGTRGRRRITARQEA